MLLRKNLDPWYWSKLVRDLDRRLLPAVNRYISWHGLDGKALAQGYSELGRLRRGDEPDYALPCVPAAYAFCYLPQRVASVFGALTLACKSWAPTRVLDIGSGTDATAVALDFWANGTGIEVVGVEPSECMVQLGRNMYCRPNIRRAWVPGNLSDVAANRLQLGDRDFDVIVMSACISYRGGPGLFTLRKILQWGKPGCKLIMIEPEAKQAEFGGIVNTLLDGNESVECYCCHDYPPAIRFRQELRNTSARLFKIEGDIFNSGLLTEHGRRVIGTPAFPVESWNPNRKDLVLVCQLATTDRLEDEPRRPSLGSMAGSTAPAVKLEMTRSVPDASIYVTTDTSLYVRVTSAEGLRLFQGTVAGRVRIDSSLAHRDVDGPIVAEALRNGRVIASSIVK